MKISPLPEALKVLISARREGWSLEQPFYTDEAIFKEDFDRVLARNWAYAGHVSRISNPGDYFIFTMGSDSLIVLRGKNGDVNAFFNVCTHRGSILCDKSEGHAKALVCPYHQWNFDLEGALRGASNMAPGFDRQAFGLRRAAVEVLEGFIFVCLAGQPPDFSPFRRDAGPAMRPHGFDKARIAHTVHKRLNCNWKLAVENFRECYHCPGGHPEYCRAVISANSFNSLRASEEEKAYSAGCEARWRGLGLSTESTWFSTEQWHLVWRFALSHGFITQSLDGQPVAPLMGSLPGRDVGVQAITTCPNFWMEASSDHAVTIRMTPLSAKVTDMEVQWLVHPGAVEGKDYELAKVMGVWKATSEQDWKLCEDNAAGVASSHYLPGPYSLAEAGSEVFVKWYLGQLLRSYP